MIKKVSKKQLSVNELNSVKGARGAGNTAAKRISYYSDCPKGGQHVWVFDGGKGKGGYPYWQCTKCGGQCYDHPN